MFSQRETLGMKSLRARTSELFLPYPIMILLTFSIKGILLPLKSFNTHDINGSKSAIRKSILTNLEESMKTSTRNFTKSEHCIHKGEPAAIITVKLATSILQKSGCTAPKSH